MKLKSLLLGVSLAAVSAFAATAETWKLAVTDVEGMERLQLEWGPFKDALEAATGDTFEFFAVNSRTAAAEALRGETVDFVVSGPAEYVVINKLTNEYLQILDFFVHFNLDEAFEETIRSRHRDAFSYDSFSEGEKQRIDLSLLFTWRQIAKMKNSVATNLLVLDETFDSSLDEDGIENLMKIIATVAEDTNVFVISHKSELEDAAFQRKIEFVKEKNFSKLKAA